MQEANKPSPSDSPSEESSKPRLSLKKSVSKEAESPKQSDSEMPVQLEEVPKKISLKLSKSKEPEQSGTSKEPPSKKVPLKPRLRVEEESLVEELSADEVKPTTADSKLTDAVQDDSTVEEKLPVKSKIRLVAKVDESSDANPSEDRSPADLPAPDATEEVTKKKLKAEEPSANNKAKPPVDPLAVKTSKPIAKKTGSSTKKKSVLPLVLCSVFLLILVILIVVFGKMLYASFESHKKTQQVLQQKPKILNPIVKKQPKSVAPVVEETIVDKLVEAVPVEVETEPIIEESTYIEPQPDPAIIRKIQLLDVSMTLNSAEGSKAKINGSIYLAGELIDEALGIRFLGVDRTKNILIFKDANGVTYARRF